MTKSLSIIFGILVVGALVYLAFVEIPVEQKTVTKTIPAEQYLDNER